MKIVLWSFVVIFLLTGFQDIVKKNSISQNFDLIELSDGVYACINKFGGKAICNAGIIDLGNETLIFDTFLSPDAAKELISTVEKYKLSPIKYIVNSHYHNDHIRGNQIFSKNIDIISTARTAQLIKEKEPIEIEAEKSYAPVRLAYYDSLLNNYSGSFSDREYKSIIIWQAYYQVLTETNSFLETRIPNVFVNKLKEIKGSKRNAQLITKGKGHTESDLILYLPDEKILFTGDLVFIGMHPYLADGYKNEWYDYLSYLQGLEINKLVPGHGKVGTREDILMMKKYLKMIDGVSNNIIKNKLSVDQIEQTKIPEPYTNWWFESFFFINLKFTTSELLGN